MGSVYVRKIRNLVFTILGIIGIVCFLQYIFFGIYGIIAGHSVKMILQKVHFHFLY